MLRKAALCQLTAPASICSSLALWYSPSTFTPCGLCVPTDGVPAAESSFSSIAASAKAEKAVARIFGRLAVQPPVLRSVVWSGDAFEVDAVDQS